MPIEGLNTNISPECGLRLLSGAPTLFEQLRYQRFYPCPIATKCPPVIDYELKFVELLFLVKIDITMTTIDKKNFEIDKIRILHDLDLLLKIRHQEL